MQFLSKSQFTFFKYFSCCTLSFLYASASSEEVNIADSLKNLLTVKQDTAQVHLRQKIAGTYQNSLPDSAIFYVKEALKLSEDLHYNKGKADALLQLGRIRRDKGEYTSALENMFFALELYETIRDSVQIGNSYNDISIVYGLSNDLSTSKEYFQKALEVFRKTADGQGESYALNNIGAIYEEEGDLKLAKEYYLKSMAIKIKRNDEFGISRGYNTLGNLSMNQKDYLLALEYFFKADSLFIKRNDKLSYSFNLNSIAKAYQAIGSLYQARDYAQQSYAAAKSINNNRFIETSLKTLVNICAAQEDFEAAYQYQLLHENISDSLITESKAKHLDELKAQFDNEQQKNEILVLKNEAILQEASILHQRSMIITLIIGLLITVSLSIALFRANKRNKYKNQLLASKNQEIYLQTSELSIQKDNLEKINQTKNKLFSIISHDIRSPLNTLKGFSCLLAQDIKVMSQDEMQRMSNQINTALDNLSQLLDNLLNWSLMQTGNMQPEYASVHINKLVDCNIELFEATAAKKGIRLVQEIEQEVYAYADYQSVNTIIRNLLSNSIKFSYQNSSIYIKAHQYKDRVEVSINDQGVGMSDEVISKIFTIDKKKSQKGTSNELGSGFGLTLCHELILQNKGEIKVSSKLKEGSTFSVFLPVDKTKGVQNTKLSLS